MSENAFLILFGVAWVAGMAYGLSAWRLIMRVRKLKEAGKAPEAPDPFTNPLDVFAYIGWLLTDRYAELNDDGVTRWAGIARLLFIIAAPLILAVFAVALTQSRAWA